MPSFDIVSKVDMHELSNALDQARREISNRFDFKGIDAKYDLVQEMVVLTAPSDFQVKQMLEIFEDKCTKRGLDVRCLKAKEPEIALSQTKQQVTVAQGIDKEQAKKIVAYIKNAKLKVQASIQGEQVRVTGKKRDDLQAVIASLKEGMTELPLQYENFRD